MNLRVLIVDDNMDAATALGFLIEATGGCAISYASNGKEALLAARRSRPDLILLDLGLPELDGFAVATQLRADPALGTSTIFAVTGYGDPEHIQRCKEVGIDRHFLKPVSFEILAPYIEQLKRTS